MRKGLFGLVGVALLLGDLPLRAAFPDRMTYQGLLQDGGAPVNGTVNLEVSLYATGVGGTALFTQSFVGVSAVNGVFAVTLTGLGSVASNNDTLYLGIRVNGGAELTPRQEFTADAYSLRAQGADDSSRLGGLLPSSWQRRVSGSCAAGSSIRVINSDGTVSCEPDDNNNAHNHLGQTWTGMDNPLAIEGSFTGAAALRLRNDHVFGNGLLVNSVGFDGVVVESPGKDGLRVNLAGGDGIVVLFPDDDGLDVVDAADDGVVVTAGGDGVDALSTGASNYGGRFRNSAAGGVGLRAEGGDNTAADLVLGDNIIGDDGRIYSAPAAPGSDILLFTNDEIHLHLDENNDESGNFLILNGANTTVFSVNESGDMTATGTKSAAVEAGAYGWRKLYAVESPENWFEDFGTARLAGGIALVALDPIFAETVNLELPYHLFLTPLGECFLYVSEKTPGSFTVRAPGSGSCDISFDYRIVAKRKGYENLRLDPFDGASDE